MTRRPTPEPDRVPNRSIAPTISLDEPAPAPCNERQSGRGGVELRFLVAIAFVLNFASPPAEAFNADQLQIEFDARLLTADEKRFLQAGLAFANSYNGLLDGAWGPGSQRALERYEVRNGRSEFVTKADVLFLAMDTYMILEKHGWVRLVAASQCFPIMATRRVDP